MPLQPPNSWSFASRRVGSASPSFVWYFTSLMVGASHHCKLTLILSNAWYFASLIVGSLPPQQLISCLHDSSSSTLYNVHIFVHVPLTLCCHYATRTTSCQSSACMNTGLHTLHVLYSEWCFDVLEGRIIILGLQRFFIISRVRRTPSGELHMNVIIFTLPLRRQFLTPPTSSCLVAAPSYVF